MVDAGQIAAVALGGALGAVGRFTVVSAVGRWIGHGFPWGTLTVNLLGSIAMGLLIEALALRIQISADLRAMLVVGFLGAFTTFSTFSLDVVALAQRGAYLPAGLYIVGSVVLCVVGLFGAMRLGHLLWGA